MSAKTQLEIPEILSIVEDQLLLAMCLKDELEEGGYRVLELAIPTHGKPLRPPLTVMHSSIKPAFCV